MFWKLDMNSALKMVLHMTSLSMSAIASTVLIITKAYLMCTTTDRQVYMPMDTTMETTIDMLMRGETKALFTD